MGYEIKELIAFLGKDPLATVNDVCQLLKVHPNTVTNWMQKGLKCERNGTGHPRFRLSELDRFFKENN
jgi:predicted site-specific integrase-resolvase